MGDRPRAWRQQVEPGYVLVRPGIDPLTPSQVDRLITAAAVLEAKRAAVLDGLVDWQGVHQYVWTAHPRVSGHMSAVADVEVRARLPESAALPYELALGRRGSVPVCRVCGRSTVLVGTRRVHANPDGTTGRVSCRAASRAWQGSVDDTLSPRWIATL